MTENEKQHSWLKTLGIILATFIGAFLAFYLAINLTINRMLSPEYHINRMEKMMQKQERSFRKFEDKMMENPFEPKMAPMLVNLVKEPNEYKIIVDLKPLGGNEKNVNVKYDNKMITVFGEMEKSTKHEEKIMNFSQSYYLNEDVNIDKMTKEKKNNKYIITIPFEIDEE